MFSPQHTLFDNTQVKKTTSSKSIVITVCLAAIAAIIIFAAYVSLPTVHAAVDAPTITYSMSPSGTIDQELTDQEGHDVYVIDTNNNQTVSWSSTNATECHVPPAPPYYAWPVDATGGATSGSFLFTLDSNAYFSIICTGEGGSTEKVLQITANGEPPTPVNHAPTITLNGDATVYLIVGDVYVENGVSFSDVDSSDTLTESIVMDPLSGVDMGTTSITHITYTVTDSGGLSASTTRTVNVSPALTGENHAPTISLVGDSVIHLMVGNAYTEQWVITNDADGDALNLSTSTNPAGGVNTLASSTWTITYVVTDTHGLSASTTRIVIVSNVSSPPSGDEPTLTLTFSPAGEVDANQTAQYGHNVSWVPKDGSETLSWSTTNATECHLPPPTPYYDWQNDDINGATSGSFNYVADSNMTFALTCTGPNGSVTKITRSIVHPDGTQPPATTTENHAPTITLNGNSALYLIIGGTYTEFGATAHDIDGNASTTIVTSTNPIGGINLTASSTWTVIYTVTDSGGLSASTTRTVYVNPAPINNGDAPTITVSIAGALLDLDKTAQEEHDVFTAIGTTTRTLSWSSTDATECHVPTPPPYYDWSDEAVHGSTTGSYQLPSNFNSYLALECSGPNGTTTKIFQLIVLPFPLNDSPQVSASLRSSSVSTGQSSSSGGSKMKIALASSDGLVLGSSSSCSIYLNENLTYGEANNPEEVAKLQAFLNEYLGTNITMNGAFGADTFRAVKKFQMSFKDQIITPWVNAGLMKDTNVGTGRVYLTTRRVINNLVCPELQLPQPELI